MSFSRRIPKLIGPAAGFLLLVAVVPMTGQAIGADLESLATDPLGTTTPFEPMTKGRIAVRAANLRAAISPLRRLLDRSRSGPGWRKYLDWDALEAQAQTDDPDFDTLAKLYGRLDAGENGLQLPQFAGVRRALGGLLEAVGTARNPEADAVYEKRLERLAGAVAAAASSGTPEPLDSVGPILARLEESGQGAGVVSRLRRAFGRPNLLLEVDERLLSRAVNRLVDEVAPVNDVLLGTRVRGTGRTTGFVTLDFRPDFERAVVDLRLDATNRSRTRGGKGPVTVYTLGTTSIDAFRRVLIDDQGLTAMPVAAHVSVDTKTTGIGVNKRFGKRLIRRIASRKVAEMKPRAEAISERRARDRVRRQFEAETAEPIAQASRDYQTKFRQRLKGRGWYPEMLHLNTDDSRMYVTARKALPDQVAAFSRPPAVDGDAVLGARLHQSFFNNLAEQELAGRTLTKEELEEQMKKAGREMPPALESDADQPPWSITFAKRKPVELTVGEGTLKMTVRGSRYTSGDREFDAMDVWATYRIDSEGGRIRLVRVGDVEIYPPGFVPGGGEKLSVQETSLRGILQKRFNKVFDEVVEIEPLELPGELESAGPLPIEQLVARKDGWVVAGWRQPDRVISETLVADPVPGEIIIREEIIPEEPVVHGGVIFESADRAAAGAASVVFAQP